MSSKTERLYNPRTPEVYRHQTAEAISPPPKLEWHYKAGLVAINLVGILTWQHNIAHISDYLMATAEQQRQDTEYAEKTLELYEDADVAVIAFGIHPHIAEDMADDIEDTFNTMSDGIITVDVAVVEPTVDAYQRYYDTNLGGCVDKNDVTTYGSYIAEQAMPELQEYDKILSLNTDPACQENIAGVASSLNTRYSEVFNASGSWNAIQANHGEQKVLTDGENGTQFINYIGSPVSTGVHELYHLFGLGHMGVLSTKAEVRGDIENMKTFSEAPKTIQFDIRNAIKQKSYSEYGDLGVMGQRLMEYSKELSTIEKYSLEWPQRKLGRESTVTEYDIQRETVTFDAKAARDAVAVYRFDANIDMKGHEYTYGFNRLVLVPKIDDFGVDDLPYAHLEAYLMDDGNNIAALGTMVNVNHENTTYVLDLDGEAIAVTIDYDLNQITVKKR